MQPTALLVNPWFYDFKGYDEWQKPLGLLYIASFLEKNGFSVQFIDCLGTHTREDLYGCGQLQSEEVKKPHLFSSIPRRYKRYGISIKEFCKRIKRVRPDVVLCTSGMTYWYEGVQLAIKLLREYLHDTPIILGGLYARLCPNHAKKMGADFVIKDAPSLFLLLNKILSCNIEVLYHLDEYPPPAFHLLQRVIYACVLTSTGCPFSCSYCASSLLEEGYRRRNIQKVADEVEWMHKSLGVLDFAFYDDALLLDAEEHLLPLLFLLEEKGVKARFHTPNGLHPRFINPCIANALFKSNFKSVRLAFETVDQRRGGGKVTKEELEDAIKALKEAGYKEEQIYVYVMMGLPGQEEKEVRESIDFVHSLGARVKLVEFSPIPGTKDADSLNIGEDEPLLHNNIYHTISTMGYDTYQRLKLAAKKTC